MHRDGSIDEIEGSWPSLPGRTESKREREREREKREI
jgi:hypothetical protein